MASLYRGKNLCVSDQTGYLVINLYIRSVIENFGSASNQGESGRVEGYFLLSKTDGMSSVRSSQYP